MNVDIHGRDVECLEHDLGHSLSVCFGVKGSLSKKYGMLLGSDTELVVEGVVLRYSVKQCVREISKKNMITLGDGCSFLM